MDTIDSLMKSEFVSVWVRDPRQHKADYWNTHIDYEICLHTNSMCFRKKTSCVRRRYSEFVWLRQRLENNSLLTKLPKLPSRNLFFNVKNPEHVSERMRGLREFLEAVLEIPLLLSDSRLHLFLQSHLSVAKVEACALGQTRYTVAHAIQRHIDVSRFPIETVVKARCDSDCESTTSSGLGHSLDNDAPLSTPLHSTPLPDCDPNSNLVLFSCLEHGHP